MTKDKRVDVLINELGSQRKLIDKQRDILQNVPKPISWNGTLNDLAYLVDVLKSKRLIDATDNEITKLFIYGTKQVTAKQLQRSRNRINDYTDPDYKPSESIVRLLGE